MYLSLIVVLVLVLDRVTKCLVVSRMTEGMSIPVIDHVVHFTYVLNPGAAFGMLEHERLFFIILTLVVLGAIALLYKKLQQESTQVQYGMALFVGGALGNLYDRMATGLVIDFIDLRIWPVFNVADIAICVGVGLILWSVVREETQKKKLPN